MKTAVFLGIVMLMIVFGLHLGWIQIPVGFKKIGEFENCSRVINADFGGTTVISPAYIQRPFKGDFITEGTIQVTDMGCMLDESRLDFGEYSYFFTYNRELESFREMLDQRLLYGKWPSMVAGFGEALNDGKVRVYRINRQGAWWPK